VRARQYDVAILAAAPWRTAAAVAASGIPVRIGLRRRRNQRFLTYPLPDESARRPVLIELARLLEPLGIDAPRLRYRLDPAPLESRRVRLGPHLDNRFAALHPFASKSDRCVALPVWVELARELGRRGFSILWIGSERELTESRIMLQDPAWMFIDRLGDGSLADTAAALSLASLFVGHDSGPLHVAGAFGVPVVGVFAPGEPLRTFPQGVGPSRMLVRPSPENISVGDILDEIDALWRDAASPARVETVARDDTDR
jgi:ADP-heptose:LPS heptosyltransferase